MTLIKDITSILEQIAPLEHQEDYDNSGLIVGDPNTVVSRILVSLDCTEGIVDEAIAKNCNLIVCHHPILFKPLKKLNGSSYVERVIMKAIKHNIGIYAIHTNLDNVLHQGVNGKIAEKLDLKNLSILLPKKGKLAKLATFVPSHAAEQLQSVLFANGAGKIGDYDSCSFNSNGIGTFKAGTNAKPFVGEINQLHKENETKIEVIFPLHLKNQILSALIQAHPYEEVAYDIILLENEWMQVGSGMLGNLEQPMFLPDFLNLVKNRLRVKVIKYTPFSNHIQKVAICGGSGSFLLKQALRAKADVFITSDFKYHEFFDAENQISICDIGHYESEQFTPELIIEIIRNNFPNFAPILAESNTNPVNYYY